MRMLLWLALGCVAGCTSSSDLVATGPTSWADLAGAASADGGSTAGGGPLLTFAVFGDSRPPNENDTANYPSAILSSIFSGIQASGAQFVVGTGDYMYAGTASAVDAQMQLYLAAQASYTNGPVYHTMGNHECNGYTDSNCPNGNETANVQAFMSKLVPSGTTTPYYRVDVDTPGGNAKLLFVAANAWSAAQQSWLSAQLADPTTYTFVVRHEPSSENTAPGVTPSDALLQGAAVTLVLYGHSHEYRRLNTQHVISGNGGAPLSRGSHYGYLIVQQKADGNLVVTEYDQASGQPVDTFTITPEGKSAS
jgi:predicted phosphodiesterase